MKFYTILRLTKEPVPFNSGCAINVAENNVYAKEEGKKTDFYQMKAFNKTSDIICQYCHTGDQVFVEGHISNNNYEKDGVKIYQNDFIIDNLKMLSNKQKEEVKKEKVIEEEDLPF